MLNKAQALFALRGALPKLFAKYQNGVLVFCKEFWRFARIQSEALFRSELLFY